MLVTEVDSHSHDSWSNFIIFAVVVYKPISRSDTTNLTFPLQVILTKPRTFITTTTSDNNEHDNDNNKKEEVGNDRDRGLRHVSVSSLRYYGMFIFFTFLNILLIFFTDWLRTMMTVMTRMTATTATTGAWDATASWTPGKFFFFLFFLISLTNTYIYSGYQDATISSPFSTTVTPSKLQPTTQDNERGPKDGTLVPSFVP